MELHTAYYSSPIGLLEIRGNEEPKQNAEFLQVANAFLKVREARNILHLRWTLVLLIQFVG